MTDHLSAEVLEQYVIGALEPLEVARVEAHVGACEACAASLGREARLEQGLYEVAAMPAPLRVRRRWVGVAASGLALAAGAAAFIVAQHRSTSRDGEPRLVRCDDPRSADDCIAKARFDGLVSLGPGAEVDVPRYDEQPGSKRGKP